MNVRDDFGFQRNDNMFLDVSGQVRKLHGPMTDSFHPMSRAPGTAMPLPCANFIFFCDIFGVEMWDRVRNVDFEL